MTTTTEQPDDMVPDPFSEGQLVRRSLAGTDPRNRLGKAIANELGRNRDGDR